MGGLPRETGEHIHPTGVVGGRARLTLHGHAPGWEWSMRKVAVQVGRARPAGVLGEGDRDGHHGSKGLDLACALSRLRRRASSDLRGCGRFHEGLQKLLRGPGIRVASTADAWNPDSPPTQTHGPCQTGACRRQATAVPGRTLRPGFGRRERCFHAPPGAQRGRSAHPWCTEGSGEGHGHLRVASHPALGPWQISSRLDNFSSTLPRTAASDWPPSSRLPSIWAGQLRTAAGSQLRLEE
ncbi:MAG: hypothetical protein JWO38_8208 [Gemmataceae bacterium]|nr:hypothetical protein [Gemmataceae bacterium]